MWTKSFVWDGGIVEFSLMPICSGKQELHHRSCEPRLTNMWCFSCAPWDTIKGNNTLQHLSFLFSLLLKAWRKHYNHWVSRRLRQTYEYPFRHHHFLAGPCHIQSSEGYMGNRFRPVNLPFPSFHMFHFVT